MSAVTTPAHDEQIVPCGNCNGRHWIETCGHPEDRSIGGACCGACEPRECTECGDGSGPYPYGCAPIEWDEDTPLDWLVTDREITDDDYPGDLHEAWMLRPASKTPDVDEEIPF